MTTLTHENYYMAFRNGDEKAFEYVYTRYYRPLLNHGQQIIRDEFTVNCIVNEAFLKGWQWREKMENMRHIYCFIRQDVSWKCYAYVRNPSNQFQRRLVHPEYIGNLPDLPGEGDTDALADNKLKAIEEALAYLSGNRQTIMTLHFKYGYSYKRIARRFGTSGQSITMEVHKSLESIKKIVHAQKRLNERKPAKAARQLQTEGMDEEIRKIFSMRYVEKQSFGNIAEKLGIPLARVQQQYVIAHRKIKETLAP